MQSALLSTAVIIDIEAPPDWRAEMNKAGDIR